MIYGFLTAIVFLAMVGLGIFLCFKGSDEKYESRREEKVKGKGKIVGGIFSIIIGALAFLCAPLSCY